MEFNFYAVRDGETFSYFQQRHNIICLIFLTRTLWKLLRIIGYKDRRRNIKYFSEMPDICL